MERDEKMDPSQIEMADGGKLNQTASRMTEDGDFKFTFGKFLACVGLNLGYFADLVDLTATSGVLSVINNDLGPSKSYAWIVTSQILGAGVFATIVGRLGDIFGRRNILFAGSLFGMIGNVICATASDINIIIGGGILIGLADAMHQVAWAALGEVVPKRSRSFAFGFFESSIASATAFGPVIGWGFVQAGSWRYIFWLCFALNGLALTFIFLFYHPINQFIHEEGKTTWQQLKGMDFIGTGLFIAAITLFLWGISVGGSLYPWNSASCLAPLVIGGVLIVVVGIYEAYAKIAWPIFPPVLFRNLRGIPVFMVSVFMYGLLFYGTAVIWPQQVAALFAHSNLQNGWYSSASGFGGVCTSPIYGWALRRFGHVKWQLVGYMAVLTMLSGVQAIVTPESHVASTALVFLVYSFVAAISISTLIMIQVIVEHELLGIATGVSVTVRTVSGAIGSAIYFTVLENKLIDYIPKYVATPLAMSGVAPADIPGIITAISSRNPAAIAKIPVAALGIAAEGFKEAYAHSFRIVYLVTIAFGAFGTVIVCFAADVDKYMTTKVEIKLDEGLLIHEHNHEGERGGHVVRLHNDDEKAVGV